MKGFIRRMGVSYKILHCLKNSSRRYACKPNAPPIVTVVGSGPAGFGVTQFLLKNNSSMLINMIEKFPVPYGLVRYGVSPDHQDVKNCINGYERVAQNPRFSFYGGITVGSDISLDEVMSVSDATVLCTGAQEPAKLGIPGENLENVFTAKEFVGWYNGEADYEHLSPDLSGKTAVIIGVGNVALDCARMLLKPTLDLQGTDVTKYSFRTLEKSKITNVILVGRRGVLQMACTRRELSEIVELEDVATHVDPDHFTEEVRDALAIKNLKVRKTQRLATYLMKSGISQKALPKSKCFNVKLLRSPHAIQGCKSATSVVLGKNRVLGGDAFNPKISATDEIEEIPCSIVISAIGYGNRIFDDRISYHNSRIQTHRGRIEFPYPLYACGWCKTGPKGVLGDTLNDCLVTGSRLTEDLVSGDWNKFGNKMALDVLLERKKIQYFTWDHWKAIDKHEVETGLISGKIREKVVSWTDMSKVAFEK